MKKNSSKGFMLVETLLVSLTISGILVYMYAQFSTINSAYQKLYDFNTANSLYRAAAVREFLLNYTNGGGTLYTGLTVEDLECELIPSISVEELNYCEGIIRAIDAKQVILTVDAFDEEDVVGIVSDAADRPKVTSFLNSIKRDGSHGTAKKRLVIIFNDGTIASVLFKF